MTPWYTDQEIDDLCAGLSNSAAKVRHLRNMGLTVTRKPNGRPLVMRGQAEVVLSGLQQITPAAANSTGSARNTNRAALIAAFGKQLRAA